MRPQLHLAIARRVADGPREIDMLEWMGRTALELIGQGGLGYSFDPLISDTANPYGDAIKNLVYVFHTRYWPGKDFSHRICSDRA